MLRADKARIEWDRHKKCWEVHIQIGAEVIKRPLSKARKGADAAADELVTQALAIGKDEGYDLDPAQVAVVQNR